MDEAMEIVNEYYDINHSSMDEITGTPRALKFWGKSRFGELPAINTNSSTLYESIGPSQPTTKAKPFQRYQPAKSSSILWMISAGVLLICIIVYTVLKGTYIRVEYD